jgi:hypothetical protein
MNATQLVKLENLAKRYNVQSQKLNTLKIGSKGYHNVQVDLARISHRLMAKYFQQIKLAELNGDTKLIQHLFEIMPEEVLI